MGNGSATGARGALTRRQMMAGALKTMAASSVLPPTATRASRAGARWRAINIMNFIRAEEPRESIDLMEPCAGTDGADQGAGVSRNVAAAV